MNIKELQPIFQLMSEQEERIMGKFKDVQAIQCDTNREVKKINGSVAQSKIDIAKLRDDIDVIIVNYDNDKPLMTFVKNLKLIFKHPKILLMTFVVVVLFIEIIVLFSMEVGLLSKFTDFLKNLIE